MPRLVFRDKTSNKFWDGRARGKQLVVTFGRTGSEGQTKKKELASPAAAEAALAKLVDEKRRKGYVDEKPAAKNASAKQQPKAAAVAKTGAKGIASLWGALEALAAATPKKLYLRPPAKESAIRAAERTMKLTFPDEFRASLLVHDGQETGDGDDSDVFPWLPGHPRLASLDRIVDAWTDQSQTFKNFYPKDPPIEIDGGRMVQYLWHPKRIPIAGNPWWDQDDTYLDFIPGARGVAGQLVCFGKGYVDGFWCARSFGAAFELYVDAVTSGTWLWDRWCLAREAKLPAKKRTYWNEYMRKRLGA